MKLIKFMMLSLLSLFLVVVGMLLTKHFSLPNLVLTEIEEIQTLDEGLRKLKDVFYVAQQKYLDTNDIAYEVEVESAVADIQEESVIPDGLEPEQASVQTSEKNLSEEIDNSVKRVVFDTKNGYEKSLEKGLVALVGENYQGQKLYLTPAGEFKVMPLQMTHIVSLSKNYVVSPFQNKYKDAWLSAGVRSSSVRTYLSNFAMRHAKGMGAILHMPSMERK